MNTVQFKEEALYAVQEQKLCSTSFAAIQNAILQNNAVGFAAGYYEKGLPIAYISAFFLHNLGYDYEEFMQKSGGLLTNVFCGENVSFLAQNRFRAIQGAGEAQLRTRDGVPVNARVYKSETEDTNGTPLWVISVRIDYTQQSLKLVNQVLRSGYWSIDFDADGQPNQAAYSHEFRTMLGYHDVLDFPNTLETWTNAIHPQDKQRVEQAFRAAFSDKTDRIKYDVQYRMRMASGKYEWFRDSGEVTRRMDGTPYRMAGIFININPEKELKQHTSRLDAFHQVYANANLCEYYVDLQANSFETLKVQPRLQPLEAGASWDELVECYTKTFVAEQDRESVLHFYNRAYLMQKRKEGKTELDISTRIFVDGQLRWVRNSVILGKENSSQEAMVIVRDITDSKNEQSEREELTRQNKVMDLLIQGTTRLVDRYAACDLENDSYKFYSQNTSDSAYAPSGAYHDFVAAMVQRFKMISGSQSLEEAFSVQNIRSKLKRPDDIYRFEYCSLDEAQYKSLAISPLSFENGQANSVLFMSQDITAEKKVEIESRKALKEAYEAANRASKAKTEFLSNMSHDIRTPMNAIVGMTAIAGANIENQNRVVDCLGKITQSSRHLLSLINEVLDMSRIESGRIDLAEEEFNLSDLCDNLVTMTKANTDLHHHQFEVHISKIEHEDVQGDSLRIQQMITNILSNAVKYTPDGGHIDFSIAELPSGSPGIGCYEFTVQDNGIGMSKKFQKVLFEPFTRADDKRTSKIQGTGLGMAIARNFAQMMNGDIRVESVPGKGSKFVVTIFLKLQDKAIAPIKELIDLPVLVVDDDQDCCETTVALLEEIGLDGEYVTSGKAAVERTSQRLAENKNYFAIILDWKMPDMDGIETAREIRKVVGKEVTIIILSAYDYAEIEQQAREAGVDDFIAKPLFRSRLTAALKNIVEGKPSAAARHYLTEIASCDYSQKRILLVEDNELNREIAQEIISMTGAKVECAENGKEAVDKVEKAPNGYFDLVFMDIQMPIMNGYEATSAIRSLPKADVKNLPIIAMTANAFAEDVMMAKNAGMNEHIAKPLDMARLKDVMRRWL